LIVPLHLHKGLKQKLIEELSKALPLMEVRNGQFFTPLSRFQLFKANQALPSHGALHDKLLSLIDDFPLMTFGRDFLCDELLRRDYDSENQLVKLTQIEAYENIDSLACRLVENFDSLPWEYALTARLPSDVSNLLSTIIKDERILSKNVSLIKATKQFSDKFPINSDDAKRQGVIHGLANLLIGGPKEGKWTEDAIYLKVQTEGFIGPTVAQHPPCKRSAG
jgi:hypothetical protein